MDVTEDRVLSVQGDSVKVFVDGQDVREVTEEVTVRDVYRELVGGLLVDGRTVTEVKLDGKVLSQDEQNEMLQEGSHSGAALELKTVATEPLIRETLEEVLKHITLLRVGITRAVEELSKGDRQKALEALQGVLNIWVVVSEAVQKVFALDMLKDGREPDPAMIEKQKKGAEVLLEFERAMTESDWVTFGDLLEYELPGVVDGWESLVKEILASRESDPSV